MAIPCTTCGLHPAAELLKLSICVECAGLLAPGALLPGALLKIGERDIGLGFTRTAAGLEDDYGNLIREC